MMYSRLAGPTNATGRVRATTVAFTLATLLALSRTGAAESLPTSPDAAGTAEHPASSVLRSAEDLAIYALGLIGVDYRYGGTSPERGLDCSGLVRYVFQQVVGVTLPRTSGEMARLGRRVAVPDLRVGDLVFFNTRSAPFSHVGIYLGDHRFVHAPHRGGEVEIVAMNQQYWERRFDGARRLIGVLPELIRMAPAEPPPSEAAVLGAFDQRYR
ncbi:MAG TPA: C40 family peptidase [Casimicrobiaceae bacterium]|jgi:cell wall-associated NlpC family hydrolase